MEDSISEEMIRCFNPARISTYQRKDKDFVPLYTWNATLAAAFLFPLSVFEVLIRNAAQDKIEAIYPHWTTDTTFRDTLPGEIRNKKSQKGQLHLACMQYSGAGNIVTHLSFSFWEHMYTRDFNKMWKDIRETYYPYSMESDAWDTRKEIHAVSRKVRLFRNRVAHNEPLFSNNTDNQNHSERTETSLLELYKSILKVIAWRSPEIAQWVEENQLVTILLDKTPDSI